MIVTKEDAQNIVAAYKGLKLSHAPEELFRDPMISEKIRSQIYSNLNIKPETVKVLEALEENALVNIDRTTGKIQFHSEDGIRQIARHLGPEATNELVIKNEKIKQFFPGQSVEEIGVLTPLDGREVNFQALKVIEKWFQKYLKLM